MIRGDDYLKDEITRYSFSVYIVVDSIIFWMHFAKIYIL